MMYNDNYFKNVQAMCKQCARINISNHYRNLFIKHVYNYCYCATTLNGAINTPHCPALPFLLQSLQSLIYPSSPHELPHEFYYEKNTHNKQNKINIQNTFSH
eukprot:24297_1